MNHKQTYRIEVGEGYIWSPKTKSDGSFNQSYINLTLVEPYDVIFSYAHGMIVAVGLVQLKAVDSVRPAEFGKVGEQWDSDGWLVHVRWDKLPTPFVPKDQLARIVPLLPQKHSPIQTNGNGNQAQYLSAISLELGELLLSLIEEINPLLRFDLDELTGAIKEDEVEYGIVKSNIPTTIKEQLIKARVGQGKFRMEVEERENKCRMTDVSDGQFLIASHIKSWKDSTDVERLDGNNGLLLSPHVDRLFDRKHITFSENGDILIPNKKVLLVMHDWGLNPQRNVGRFTDKQQEYLAYHRNQTLSRVYH